jgi:hypothetical protein
MRRKYIVINVNTIEGVSDMLKTVIFFLTPK